MSVRVTTLYYLRILVYYLSSKYKKVIILSLINGIIMEMSKHSDKVEHINCFFMKKDQCKSNATQALNEFCSLCLCHDLCE